LTRMEQAMSDDWTLTFPCTRQEAEALGQDYEFLASLDPMPSLVGEEMVAFDDNQWRIVAYFNGKPPKAVISALQQRIPSAANTKAVLEKLADQDWLVISQQGLEPVQAGRFFVHTPEHADGVPKDAVSFVIPASQAFGTGGHETTSGCLAMLDRIKRQGGHFENIADIGTGTGLLAFGAGHLWPHAYITASDIDPVSVNVTLHNADINHVAIGHGIGKLALCAAMGTDHILIQRRAPYDLLIANILAGPLIELADAFAEVTQDGGTVILAGLLNTQVKNVLRAYRAQGFRLQSRSDNGDWPCLRLVKRRRYGWRRPLRANSSTSQTPGDFGTW
jgi:ribosomal protein L11 methyltransferase